MDNDNFRTIESVGRGELIDELMDYSSVQRDGVVKAFGDDAAVLADDGTKLRLLSSESFMEGVDFDLTYVPLHHLGYKIGTAAVSDIYAMNGSPEAVLVNISVPNKISVDMLKEIYRGIGAAGKDYNFQIVGGDLTASHQVLSVSISCYGSVAEEQLTYRSGAHTEDAICITGDIGASMAGLRILLREKKFWQEQDAQQAFQPDLEDYQYVVKRQLLPVARKDFIELFNEMAIKPSSMIDLSKGLLSDLKNICHASHKGAYIYESALPIALDTRTVADEMKEDVDRYGLYGGEDYELMFTLSESQTEKLADKSDNFSIIGKITDSDEGICLQKAEGEVAVFDED